MTKISSFTSSRALLLAILATAAGAATAPSAWADGPLTLCVHQSQSSASCPAGATDEGGDLQGALTAAAAHPASPGSPNVIDIEAGTYTSGTTGFSYNSSNPLRIDGAGSDSTTVTDNAGETLSLGSSSAARTISVSGLTVTNLAGDAHALTLTGGTADHLVVSTTQAGAVAVTLTGATLSDSTVYAQYSFAGVEAPSDATPGSSVELDDDTINGGTDAVQTSVPTTIHRVTLTGQSGLFADSAPVSIDDSLIEAQQGITSLAISTPASIEALNDTIVATQPATQGVRASSYGGTTSDVQVLNSIIYAFPTSFATYDDGANDHATIESTTNSYDGSASGSGITRGAPIGDYPGFVAPLAGNYHLTSDSELIDISATQSLGSNSSTTDRDGNPRVVTVDHAATPVDLGAYEYQPPAPAGGNPGSGGGNPGSGGGNPASGGGNPGVGANPGTGSPSAGTPSNGSRPTLPSRPAPTVKLTPIGHPSVTGKRISLRLSCGGTAACSPVKGTATAINRHHRVTVGSVTTRLSAGHRTTLTLTLNRAGRALLASTGRLTVTLTVTVRTGARTLTVETAHLRLT